MRKMWLLYIAGTALMLVLKLASCSEQACYDDTDPFMNTALLATGTGSTAKATSIKVEGVSPTDTITFVEKSSVSYFSVPLDPGRDSSKFYITINGISDTAVITYTRRPHLVSAECGYTFVSDVTALSHTKNIIDTLIIENKNVNLDGKTNLHLFF